MDTRNRQFFRALNRIEHTEGESKIDVIDINNFKIEDLAEKYEKYIIWFSNFMKSVNNPEKAKQFWQEKINFDKIYRFWINPYRIALRNTIGRIGIGRQDVETIKTDKGDKARITQETINKIRNEVKGNESKQNVIYEDKFLNTNQKVEQLEEYSFDTGIANQLRTYIRKYKISFELEGIEYSKQIYGEIDINKFERDEEYRKVILEGLENLEIDNYNKMERNDYIGSFQKVTKNEENTWQNILKDGDIDAINQIKQIKERYKTELQEEVGDER